MSDFHDNYPSYETMAHHDEATGKKVRRKLWNVFWIMLGITLLELYIGFQQDAWELKGTTTLKFIFIGLTIVKAAYIVLEFMHLGGENKTFRYIVLIPYIAFIIYLIAMLDLGEGSYSKEHREVMDKHYSEKPMQHHEGGASHEAAHHE
jgi:cytochrome c oxidase subunit IV